MWGKKWSDRAWVWWIVFVYITLVLIPFLFTLFMIPPGQVFTGTSVYSPIDLPVYFADIQQIAQGDWLVRDLFTTEGPQTGMFHVLWFVLGLVARTFHLEPWQVFHGARFFLLPLLVWSVWWGVKVFLPQRLWRVGTLMVLFASGTGALINKFLERPDISQIGMDYWMPEGFVFMSSLQSPHYILSLSLFFLVLATWCRSIFSSILPSGDFSVRWTVISGLLASLLFSFHPFHVFTIPLIIIAHVFVLMFFYRTHWKRLLGLLFLWGVLAFPGAFYQIWLQWGDPVLQARSFQSTTQTPSFEAVYLCLGALWLFGLVGIIRLWKTHQPAAVFLLVWGVVQSFALFAPIQVNRRFLMGLPMGLSVAAVVGWWWIFQASVKVGTGFLKKRWTSVLAGVWSLVVGPVLVIVIFGFSSISAFMTFLRAPIDTTDFLYMTQAQRSAYQWIEQQTAPEDVILVTNWAAVLLPGETGRTTYVGHWHETLHWAEKLQLAQQAFSKDSRTTKRALEQIDPEYIVVQPDQAFVPTTSEVLVFEQEDWKIYQHN